MLNPALETEVSLSSLGLLFCVMDELLEEEAPSCFSLIIAVPAAEEKSPESKIPFGKCIQSISLRIYLVAS